MPASELAGLVLGNGNSDGLDSWCLLWLLCPPFDLRSGRFKKIYVMSSLDRCLAQARPVALLTWVLTAVTSEGRGQQVGNLSYF